MAPSPQALAEPPLSEHSDAFSELSKLVSLRSALRAARPTWTQKDLAAVEEKLASVGVSSSGDLARVLLQTAGAAALNRRLQRAGLKAFGRETLSGLRTWLGLPGVRALILPTVSQGEADKRGAGTPDDSRTVKLYPLPKRAGACPWLELPLLGSTTLEDLRWKLIVDWDVPKDTEILVAGEDEVLVSPRDCCIASLSVDELFIRLPVEHGYSGLSAFLRCDREQARAPIRLAEHKGVQPGTRTDFHQRGITYGMDFPSSSTMLKDQGAAWLTRAFRASGVLGWFEKVSSIKRMERVGRQAAGDLYALEVGYSLWPPEDSDRLHAELLVRLPLPGAAVARAGAPLASSSWGEVTARRLAEVNLYRLLEAKLPLRLPKFYFGDVSEDASSFILITERLPHVGGDDISAESMAIWGSHLDRAPVDWCEALMKAGARMAGMHKSGALGPSNLLELSFDSTMLREPPRLAPDGSWVLTEASRISYGRQDFGFTQRAIMAQEFVGTAARHLFSEELTGPKSMRAYRSVLFAAEQNSKEIDWWLNTNHDYVALCFDRVDRHGAFCCQFNAEGTEVVLATWQGVCASSLGQKIWRWLCCAPLDVLTERLASLLSLFIQVFVESGGPNLSLELLMLQVQMSVVADSVQQLDLMPELYQCIPKEQWASVADLTDKRLPNHIVGQGCLWSFLACFSNTIALIKHFDMGQRVSDCVNMVMAQLTLLSNPVPFLVPADRADLFSEPQPTATLVCRLPRGIVAHGLVREGVGEEKQTTRAKGGMRTTWVQLLSPVPGWADLICLRPLQLNAIEAMHGFMRPKELALSRLLGVMFHVKKMFTGDNPLGACGVSAEILCKEIVTCDLESPLGRGKARVINGSFLAKKGSHTWWPHSFVVFGDGSIADITADQFDNVPQIWFPAERSRYSFMVADDKTRVEGGQPAQADESDGTLILFGKWQLPPPGALLPGAFPA